MISFVIDSSVALAWLFQDEVAPYSESVLAELQKTEAIVPLIWPLEIMNVLETAVAKGRLSRNDADASIGDLLKLRIYIDQTTSWPPGDLLRTLMADGGLTSYDACYVCLAHRYRVPLATLDEQMREGALKAGVAMWNPQSA